MQRILCQAGCAALQRARPAQGGRNVGNLLRDRNFDAEATVLLRRLVKEDDLTHHDYSVSRTLRLDRHFSIPDVYTALQQLNISYKVRTKHNNRADRAQQLIYLQRMWSKYFVQQLMFADEACFDRKTGLKGCASLRHRPPHVFSLESASLSSVGFDCGSHAHRFLAVAPNP